MIAIVVGHSRIGDRGAISVGNVYEHTYNKEVANLLSEELTRLHQANLVVNEIPRKGYEHAMNWLADFLHRAGAKVALELHFNSAGAEANGREFLYYIASKRGRALATCLNEAQGQQFPSQFDRGIKSRRWGNGFIDNRGWQFLGFTRCPAVICEPFFGSNRVEWETFKNAKSQLAAAYAQGIERWSRL